MMSTPSCEKKNSSKGESRETSRLTVSRVRVYHQPLLRAPSLAMCVCVLKAWMLTWSYKRCPSPSDEPRFPSRPEPRAGKLQPAVSPQPQFNPSLDRLGPTEPAATISGVDERLLSHDPTGPFEPEASSEVGAFTSGLGFRTSGFRGLSNHTL